MTQTLHTILLQIILCFTIIIFNYLFFNSIKNLSKFFNDKNSKKFTDTPAGYNDLKMQCHDFNNHLETINMFLNMNRIKKAKTYLKNLGYELTTISTIKTINNEALKSLLLAKIDQARLSGITIKISVLKPFTKSKVMDRDLIRITGNLINNAIEAQKNNKNNNKTIEVIINRNPEYNIIIVNTIGVLIAKNIMHKIFNQGFSKKNKSNHGLGLNICRQLVTFYQGKIKVKRNENQKTTSFIVKLPAGDSPTNKKMIINGD